MNYHKAYPQLELVYLEDSYVLEIEELSSKLRFVLLAVLCEDHPKYRVPKQNEQHCYVEATLVFEGTVDLRWLDRSRAVHVDPDGSTDMGNIDTFSIDEGVNRLSGGWGNVEFRCKELRFQLGEE